jgi:hypothetical protein
MGKNIHTAKEGEGGCKKGGLEIYAAETKYVFKSHKQNPGQDYNKWEVSDPLKAFHSSNIWKQHNKEKVNSRRNEEQIELRKYLTPFGT